MAALNPLVYWHQIFGANDLVFVAMLLAAVLAARGSRPLAAGALVGLACATKQLAWPFAPFLLLSLSGARSFRDLLDAASWRRLLAPIAAAAAVFLLVVAPVAALDPRAFWGDIVVYNVGLPGGDNYPLGGTPGIGVANFLIYFGRVADLREYFPFSVFYLLLVPLGLLLVRAQLRDGHPEWALATGSTALVASIYFSRVVHPNYLIPAAVCLPLAVLARKRGADIAARAAAAAGARRRGGRRRALPRGVGAGRGRRPRAGCVGSRGGARAARASGAHEGPARAPGERHRRGPGRRVPGARDERPQPPRAPRRSGAGVALVVLVPVLFLAGLGTRTGVVRAQDPLVVQAAADASRLLRGQSPYTPPPETTPRGREAVSASFRLDPPAEWLPTAPLVPPGPAVLAALARLVGVRDLRLVAVLALVGLAGVLAACFEGRRRRAAVALALLSAPLALGTVLGAPAALSLVALVSAWAARERGAVTLAGALAGAAVGLDHRVLLVAPFVALPDGSRASLWRALAAAVAAYALLVAPVALLDLGSFLGRATAPSAAGPGLGLVNLLAYRGAEGAAAALGPVAMLAALAGVVWLLRRPWPTLARAGIASLLGIVLAPAVSAEAVAAPILLLALAAVVTDNNGQRKRTTDNRKRMTETDNGNGKTGWTELEGGHPAPPNPPGKGNMPEAGFEPARISPHAPQTCVSASSTTPAQGGTNEQTIVFAGPGTVNAHCPNTVGREHRIQATGCGASSDSLQRA